MGSTELTRSRRMRVLTALIHTKVVHLKARTAINEMRHTPAPQEKTHTGRGHIHIQVKPSLI